MNENISDTDRLVHGKRKDNFQKRVQTLRVLISILLVFGIAITIFSSITWNNSSNDILRSLAVTGVVTIIASIIGLIGCNRSLKHFEVIKTNKMNQSPGQEALLIFFYFNFLLFCAFLLFGTWCFFYQDDATAWVDAKYADKASWEKDFKGISLKIVQDNLKLILSIAGVLSLTVGIVNFACIYYSMKISVYFENIHTIVQVQNLVIILISFLIIYAGAIAKGYYNVPYVAETEPEFLPQVLIFTGVAMIMVAFLGYFASKAESKYGLVSYSIFCIFLMLNFLIFIVLLNFGSQILQTQFEEKCNEVMPYFHKNFYESFGCVDKYTQNSSDPFALQCPKTQIATMWEANVGVAVDDQSEKFGCLNEKCCIAMISFVKGKFNFLAAFCIVAFFFTLVAIMTSQYMYKKIKKYHTQILSHRNDNFIFVFMLLFTVIGGTYLTLTIPNGPKGMPQPDRSLMELPSSDLWRLYDLQVDRTVGLGSINDEGWWNFERMSLFQQDYNPKTNQTVESDIRVEVNIQTIPPNGEFMINGENTQFSTIDPKYGNVTVKGKVNEVNRTLSELRFRPGCINDPNNALEVNITFTQTSKRNLQESDEYQMGVPKRYRIPINLNSGYNRTYRGKIIEENLEATGPHNYFKEVFQGAETKVQVTLPHSKTCPVITVPVDSHGIFEFNMSLLNLTVPYLMKIQADKGQYQSIVFDYFIGGYPRTERVELGSYAFYTSDNKNHNVTGRLYEAFTNKTFQEDYTLTVYQGYGELNKTKGEPYEVIEHSGGGIYYTGDYEIFDLKSGSYVAVIDTPIGFIKNFQRFYALPSPPFTKQMRSIPLVPELNEGELALVLTWGYSPRDLDIHVEFVASPTILCKCDFSLHSCGGVKYMTDTTTGGDRGADVIKFDYVGDYQYLVYISLYKQKPGKNSTSTNQQNNEASLAESQAQLKVFAPYYSWPVYIFDVPAAAANQGYNYWTVFCLNGKDGLKKLVPINHLHQGAPDVSTCQEIFGTRKIIKSNFIAEALKQNVDVQPEQDELTVEESP